MEDEPLAASSTMTSKSEAAKPIHAEILSGNVRVENKDSNWSEAVQFKHQTI